MANGEGAETKARQSTWADLLKSAGQQLIPVIVTGASLIGFVAFAGAVIVWTRFSAAKVPPDQAVAALPQNELVAVGSSFLLIFGFFGALAVLGVFLIDRGGRATPGMSRGLLLLLMTEGVAAIVFVDGPSLAESIVAIELFLLPMAVAFWSTFAAPFIRLRTDLPDREGNEPEAEAEDRPFRLERGGFPLDTWEIVAALVVVAECACFAAYMAWDPFDLGPFDGSFTTAALVGLATLGLGLALAIGLQCLRFYRGEKDRTRKRRRRRKRRQRRWWAARARERDRKEALRSEGRWVEAGRMKKKHLAEEAPRDPDGERPKPPRLELSGPGAALMVAMTALAVTGPSLVFGRIWLAAALVAALVLVAGLWRIADLAEARFLWYGLAVFISVPLFGTLASMARNLDDPQVQPMALIRNTDGPDEAIQGLYVTEGDDRVYFATVSTEGCSERLTPHSGRLLWVPKSEVVALSIGPLQSIDDAAKTSLEMAYALTPAVETQGGGHINPTTPAQNTFEAQIANGKPAGDHRLENVGVAVRPNFGAGLSLSPTTASPGDVVTLRMSAPNDESGVEGFGRRRGGRTLRLGGVRVDVLKERAPSPWDAEYVATGEGEALRLEKGRVYVKSDDDGETQFKEVDEASAEGRLYVKLIDKSVVSVSNGEKPTRSAADDGATFLPLRAGVDRSQLSRGLGEGDTRPLLETKGGDRVRLEYSLLRQAWHEDHIRFRVPDNAGSGPVTVECNQLAGQPLLRVSRPPMARIAVRTRPGSDRVLFSSRFSKDHDGKVKALRWNIEGISRGHDPRIAENLPPSDFPYTVRLTVTDAQHHSDTAEVRLLRLWPGQLSSTGGEKGSSGGTQAPAAQSEPEKLHAILSNSVVKEPGFELEMDLHEAQPETSPEEDLEGAEALGRKASRKLLTKTSLPDTFPPGGVPVRALVYGDRCPPTLRTAHRRLDIFVLSDGAQVLPPPGCIPGRVERTAW